MGGVPADKQLLLCRCGRVEEDSAQTSRDVRICTYPIFVGCEITSAPQDGMEPRIRSSLLGLMLPGAYGQSAANPTAGEDAKARELLAQLGGEANAPSSVIVTVGVGSADEVPATLAMKRSWERSILSVGTVVKFCGGFAHGQRI